MCGISGIYAFNQVGAFYMMNLAKSLDLLNRRGPDARGTYIEDFYAVGHRRLSIIDTDYRSNQPMKDASSRYVLSFNGEIFNYKSIRTSLQEKGIVFNTESDSEVLLQNYILKKEKCLDDFVGFFAFSVFDTETKELFLARDRFGIKPLLYAFDEDKLVYASEMKSIIAYNFEKKINPESVVQYFQLNYVAPQHTIFKQVHKLQPGHYLTLKGRNIKIQKYYQLPLVNQKHASPSYGKAVVEFKKILTQSVHDRLVSDVPLGTFLSGGIDSTIISGIAAQEVQHLNTFSIGYEGLPLFDESKYALAAAKKFGTEHHVFQLKPHHYNDFLFEALDYIDEPFADSAMLPLYFLTKQASKQVKVALAGDGADELLGGYNKHAAELKIREKNYSKVLAQFAHFLSPFIKPTRKNALGNLMRKMNKFNRMKDLSAPDRYYELCLSTPLKKVQKIIQSEYFEAAYSLERKQEIIAPIALQAESMNDVFAADIQTVLVGDMLYKVDMMSMANGLEVRVPFLDHRLVDFVQALPANYKIDAHRRKKIAKDAFSDLIPSLILNRPKKGFDVPVEQYLYNNEQIADFFRMHVTFSNIAEQGIFNYDYVKRFDPNNNKTLRADSQTWWAYFVFQYWYFKNLK
jgi:asparagine synthase (glutamine-hydrolysing)